MASVVTANEKTSDEFEILPQDNDGSDSLDSDFSLIPMPVEPPVTYALVNGRCVESDDPMSYDLSEEQMQTLVKELLDSNRSMKEKLLVNNDVMKEQVSTISEWHNQVTSSMAQQQLSLQEAKDEIARLQKENFDMVKLMDRVHIEALALDELYLETDSVRSDLKNALSKNEEQEILLTKKAAEIEQLNKDLDEKDQLLHKSQKEVTLKNDAVQAELTQVLSNTTVQEQKITDLKLQLVDLESNLYSQQHSTEAEKMKHAETKKLYDVLQSKYDHLLQELRCQNQRRDLGRDMDSLQRQYLEQIDSLTASKFDLEQKLEAMAEDVALMKSKKDNANMLKTQVEVFKSELESCEQAKKEALDQVEALKAQLNELQSTVPLAPEPSASSIARGQFLSDRIAGSHKNRQYKKDKEFIVCPVCDYGFTDITAAQNHVNNCLDKSI